MEPPPDISMCKSHKCPKKETCYRYKAVPNPYRQAYMDFVLERDNCYVEHKPKNNAKEV